jgi:hypothetical protein
MKPGALTFPMPPLTADPVGAALPAALPSLIRQLTGLADWPEDHGIRVRQRGQYAPLVYARVATSRHVVEILFDPSTGQYECTNSQAIDVALPMSIPDEAQGSFVVAVIRGLSAAAATALLHAAIALLEPCWPHWAAIADAGGVALDDAGSAILPDAVRRKRAA